MHSASPVSAPTPLRSIPCNSTLASLIASAKIRCSADSAIGLGRLAVFKLQVEERLNPASKDLKVEE